MLFNDSFLESILKNPLNIKNHKLYRFIRLDGDLIGKIDELILRASDINKVDDLVLNTVNLINMI